VGDRSVRVCFTPAGASRVISPEYRRASRRLRLAPLRAGRRASTLVECPLFGPAADGGIGFAERSPRRPCRRGAASPRSGRRLRRTLRGMVAGGTRRPPISVSMIRHKNRPAVWFPPLPLPPRPPLPATPFQRGRVHTGGEGRGKSPLLARIRAGDFLGGNQTPRPRIRAPGGFFVPGSWRLSAALRALVRARASGLRT
jgi:hypothetical protein